MLAYAYVMGAIPSCFMADRAMTVQRATYYLRKNGHKSSPTPRVNIIGRFFCAAPNTHIDPVRIKR